MRRKVASFLSMVLLASILAACSGAPKSTTSTVSNQGTEPAAMPEVAKPSGTVTIYSSASKDLLDNLSASLKVKYPDLTVEWVAGGTEQLIEQLNEELAANNVKADAVMMADPAYARLLKNQGLLLPHKPANINNVVVDKDPDGFYNAIRVVDVVIIYNTDLVKPEEAPKSFKDLLDPKWNGQVAMSDPTKSGTAFATAGALVNTYGWSFFEQAQANGWQVGGGSSAPIKKVAEGKAKVALAVESSFRSEQAKGAKVEMVWPADGAIVLESPYAIMKSTDNPVAAKAVSDFMITPEAQALVVKAQMHPVLAGIDAPTGSIPLAEIVQKAMKVDWKQLAEEKGEIQDRFLKTVKVLDK